MDDSLGDWLALREPHDRTARSAELVRHVAEALPSERPLRIVDLGTGRGSNVRYLSSRLPMPQNWLLLDRDAELLAEIPRAMAGSVDERCHIETRQMDLGTLDPSVVAGCDLVTASALLDLVSDGWLRSLAGRCRDAGAVGLFALTYNGQSRCSPAEPEDDMIRELMNQHQRSNDKGFGRAAGPDAVDAAARAFSHANFRVLRAASNWDLPPDAVELQRRLVEGWSEAALEIAPLRSSMILDWKRRRLAHVDSGRSRIVVYHEDFAAFPT